MGIVEKPTDDDAANRTRIVCVNRRVQSVAEGQIAHLPPASKCGVPDSNMLEPTKPDRKANVKGEPRPRLARLVRLGAQDVTAGVVGSSAWFGRRSIFLPSGVGNTLDCEPAKYIDRARYKYSQINRSLCGRKLLRLRLSIITKQAEISRTS